MFPGSKYVVRTTLVAIAVQWGATSLLPAQYRFDPLAIVGDLVVPDPKPADWKSPTRLRPARVVMPDVIQIIATGERFKLVRANMAETGEIIAVRPQNLYCPGEAEVLQEWPEGDLEADDLMQEMAALANR